jgi:hypothetical protein
MPRRHEQCLPPLLPLLPVLLLVACFFVAGCCSKPGGALGAECCADADCPSGTLCAATNVTQVLACQQKCEPVDDPLAPNPCGNTTYGEDYQRLGEGRFFCLLAGTGCMSDDDCPDGTTCSLSEGDCL